MSTPATPLIEISGVVRSYGGLRPLRIASFVASPADRVVLAGFDAGAAEAFVLLVTGAMLPESGDVRVDGRSTRDIGEATEWLTSLDRFGLVTDRAVLIGALSLAANLALPLTLAIDPLSDQMRRTVEALAAPVGFDAARLSAPAGDLTPAERMRVHLVRAVAPRPAMLLLEHPTGAMASADEAAAFGALVADVATRHDCGWIALSEDRNFADAAGGRRLRLKPGTGQLVDEAGGWRKWF